MATSQISSPPQLRASINQLPQEILLEILSRLPVESVLECKLLSKQWLNAVQHESLPQMNLNRLNSDLNSGKSSMILSRHDEYPFYYAEYDQISNRFSRTAIINLSAKLHPCCILGSCNGLICFLDWDNSRPAYICNPITREYITLPKPEGEQSQFMSGFGYIPSTNEYKVVVVCNSEGEPNYGIVQIYTLGSGLGWRNLGSTRMNYDVRIGREKGVFANGFVHWVDMEGTVVAFDLDDEEIRVIPSPPFLPQAGNVPSIPKLQILGDLLCAKYKCDGGLEIWVLKKYNNNEDVIWSKEFSHIDAKPITFTKSGELLCYDGGDDHVYRYTPGASSSRMVVCYGENCKYGVPHKNTLVSLEALEEEDTELMDSGE